MTLIGTVLDWAHLAIVASVLCLSTVGQYILLAFNALFPFPTALEQLHRRSRPLQRTVMRDRASPEFISSRNCIPMAFTTKNPPAHGGQGSSINGSCLFSLFQANLGMRTARIEGRRTARELVEAEGFGLEDHHAVTPDGFVLVMHRVVNSDRTRSGAARHKPVVLLMHGLMQDSEALLCGGRDHSLGLRLAAAGFDVFLGNARGNRYSHKVNVVGGATSPLVVKVLWHMRMSPQTSDAYWNFSIDELARFDTPTMVEHALKVSRQGKLCYIGFSQGTAQAFAAFSSNADLLDKICLFVTLSPAARANHLSPSLLLSLVQANLRFLYLIFGRRRMLPVALTWQRIMSRSFFIATIDVAVGYLFSWKSTQVSAERKFELYPHIYSYSSVKCVVHWFQMMYSGRLSMFADSPAAQYIPVTYDVRQISCPVAIFYGGNDHLVEVETLKSTLPNVVMSTRVEDYEHLDTMWADTAKDTVFPKVEALVKQFYPATNGNIQGNSNGR